MTMVYRRSEREVSAYPHELDFIRREGVGFRYHAQPVRVIAENGRVAGLVCAEPAAGLEFVVPADQIVKAIGQEKPSLARTLGLEVHRGFIQVNADFEANIPGVFAGGDCIRSREYRIDGDGRAGRQARRECDPQRNYEPRGDPAWLI